MSTKGIQKATNKFAFETFKHVLYENQPVSGTNRGFVVDKSKIKMYTQERIGLSPYYVKRKVLDDRISTVPLDL